MDGLCNTYNVKRICGFMGLQVMTHVAFVQALHALQKLTRPAHPQILCDGFVLQRALKHVLQSAPFIVRLQHPDRITNESEVQNFCAGFVASPQSPSILNLWEAVCCYDSHRDEKTRIPTSSKHSDTFSRLTFPSIINEIGGANDGDKGGSTNTILTHSCIGCPLAVFSTRNTRPIDPRAR